MLILSLQAGWSESGRTLDALQKSFAKDKKVNVGIEGAYRKGNRLEVPAVYH